MRNKFNNLKFESPEANLRNAHLKQIHKQFNNAHSPMDKRRATKMENRTKPKNQTEEPVGLSTNCDLKRVIKPSYNYFNLWPTFPA